MKNIHRTAGFNFPLLPASMIWAVNGKAMAFREQDQRIAALSCRQVRCTINSLIKFNQTINLMKINNQSKKVLATLLILVAGMLGAKAQVTGLPNTGDMPVCLNAIEDYGVEDNPTSTFTWKIDGETVSPTSDWVITSSEANNNKITVEWKKVGNFLLTVQEKTASNCFGPMDTIRITVNPLPEMDSIPQTTVCSDSKIGVLLPSTDKNGIALIKYVITANADPLLIGNPTTGTFDDINAINAIKDDIFTNNTTSDLKVVYRVVPYSGSCPGDVFTITVTISSGPQVTSSSTIICSDSKTEVELPSTDNNNAFIFDTFDITAVADPLLIGNPTTGTFDNINAIKDDIFTNPTTGDLTVVYSVTPHAGSCVGKTFTITVTVNPAVKTPTIYHK